MRGDQRHFGVEIECVTDERTAAEVGRRWAGWHYHHEHCGLEIVSPPLTQRQGMYTLRSVLNFLKPHASVTNACGGHVHLEAHDLSLAMVRRFVYSWENNQENLMQMVAPNRHNNGYAHRWDSGELQRLDRLVNPPRTPRVQEPDNPFNFTFHNVYGWHIPTDGGRRRSSYEWTQAERNAWDSYYTDLRAYQRTTRTSSIVPRGGPRFAAIRGFDRYKTVNICALPEHGTIEIRQGHATLEPDEAEGWIRFCMQFLNDVVERKRILRQYKTPANLMRFVKVDGPVRAILNEKIANGGRLAVASPFDPEDDYYEDEGDRDYYDDDDDDYYEDDPW